MYLIVVALTMAVLPVGTALFEWLGQGMNPSEAVGRSFVFWAVGLRLGLAGVRQFAQPGFTARSIFKLSSDEALPLIRELAVANLAIGLVGLLSPLAPDFVLPTAIYATIFYVVAGARHAMEHARSFNENVAMISDLFVGAMLAIFVGHEAFLRATI